MANLTDSIISTLQGGPISAAALARRLGVDPTTITRRLNDMGDRVIKGHTGRATRWYLPRTLPMQQNDNPLPIYRVNRDGSSALMANLYVVYPVGTFLMEYFRSPSEGAELDEDSSKEWTYYESLPWWLTDMRPQGFLGRSFAQQLRAAGEPVDANPARWNEDIVLAVLAKYPQDHIGNLLVGKDAYERWLVSEQEPICSDEQAEAKAEAISRGEHFDSSAQGEQPKFTARLVEGECIVKFSGRVLQRQADSVAGRWSDLLHAEAVSAIALNKVLPGIAAENRSVQVNDRTLLASKRFDRTGSGGRIGVISFASLDAEFVGKANQPWPVIADALYQKKVLTETALTRCKVAWAFGQLIANSDMHLGNVSAVSHGGRPYELAPIYDMLPMYFAPRTSGDLPSAPATIHINSAVSRVCWEAAYPAAVYFWQQVLEHPNISDHFKELAKRQLHAVLAFESVLQRMA